MKLLDAKVRNYVDGLKARIKFIVERSFIIPFDERIALLAADVKHEFKLHTVD